MAKVSKIESELLEATGLSPNKGESRKDFLLRLAEYLDDDKKFTDADYNKLTDDSQKWANGACQALGKHEDIPEFPGVEKEAKASKSDKAPVEEESDESETPAEEAEEEGEEKVESKKGKKAAAKPAPKKANGKAPAKEAKADTKKAAKPETKKAPAKKAVAPAKEKAPKKAGGKSAVLKKLILKDPEMSNADLMGKMEKAGHKMSMSTLSTIRSGFLHSMQVIADEGRLRPAKD